MVAVEEMCDFVRKHCIKQELCQMAMYVMTAGGIQETELNAQTHIVDTDSNANVHNNAKADSGK